jgi:hypothetical protein
MGWGSWVMAGIVGASKLYGHVKTTGYERDWLRQIEINNINERKVCETPAFRKASLALPSVNRPFQQELLPVSCKDEDLFYEASQASINTIISGGNKTLRNRSLEYVCNDAYQRAFPTVIFHCGNNELTAILKKHTIRNRLSIVDGNTLLYNPFDGLAETDISRIISESIPIGKERGQYDISKSMVRLFVKIIYHLLVARKKSISLANIITCDLGTLKDKIEDEYKNGNLSQDIYNRLKSEYIRCQTHRDNIQDYFEDLKTQVGKIYTFNKAKSLDIEKCLKHCQIVVIDLKNSLNKLLISLATEHLRYLYENGQKMLVVIDGVKFSANPVLPELMIQHDECNFAISSDDIFADYSSDKAKMKTLVGYTDRVMLFKHKGDGANDFWSEKFGEYDKIVVNQGFNTNTGAFIPSRGSSKQESHTRETRVKPEELATISNTQVCLYSPQDDMVVFAEFGGIIS